MKIYVKQRQYMECEFSGNGNEDVVPIKINGKGISE